MNEALEADPRWSARSVELERDVRWLYERVTPPYRTPREIAKREDVSQQAVEDAIRLCGTGTATFDKVEKLSQGWTAEEALAISLYCALTADNFEEGVVMAVNHGGDSDSTGSITGQILGALYGLASIPNNWLDRLELRDTIDVISRDLYSIQIESVPSTPVASLFHRYPPN